MIISRRAAAAGFAVVIIAVLAFAFEGIASAQCGPLPCASDTPGAASVVTYMPVGLAAITLDALGGGGQAVVIKGVIAVHVSTSLEALVNTSDGRGVLYVQLQAPLVDVDETQSVVVSGVVGKMVGATINTTSYNLPEIDAATIVNAAPATPTVTLTPSATPTATTTGTLDKTQLAATRIANATATRQALYDNLTATASAVGATRTAHWDNVTATANAVGLTRTGYWDNVTATTGAIYATRTEQAAEYQATATWYAENYTPPAPTSGPYVQPTSAPSGSGSGGPPSGATALCNDGTYSFSQHRRGTCSGHHGVAQWLANLPE